MHPNPTSFTKLYLKAGPETTPARPFLSLAELFWLADSIMPLTLPMCQDIAQNYWQYFCALFIMLVIKRVASMYELYDLVALVRNGSTICYLCDKPVGEIEEYVYKAVLSDRPGITLEQRAMHELCAAELEVEHLHDKILEESMDAECRLEDEDA